MGFGWVCEHNKAIIFFFLSFTLIVPSFYIQTMDLLTYDPGTVPIVKRTSKGEFLVNAGTFGVIAVANGISNVSPLQLILYKIVVLFSP